MGTFIVAMIVLLMVSGAVYTLYRDKKSGRACSSCKDCGSCPACEGRKEKKRRD